MRYRISHRTSYTYEIPALSSRHVAHLEPRHTQWQQVSEVALRVEPRECSMLRHLDYYGNVSNWFEISQEHRALSVTASSVVDLGQNATSGIERGETGNWEEVRDFLNSSAVRIEDREFCVDSPLLRRQASLALLAQETFEPGRNIVEAVVAFNQWIRDNFRYDPTATAVGTPINDVIQRRAGVCQDFAHIAVGALRSLGLAARYVSGYLETRPPPGQPRLVGADASHAWASVFVPSIGWLDFDPTNAVLPTTRHITVAWGRDFSDVSPLKGVVLGGGLHSVSVGVDMKPEAETARNPMDT